MDKDLKKLIDETVYQFIENVCLCGENITDEDEFTDDGGKTWRHIKCGKFINENLPLSGEEKYYQQEPGGQMAAVNVDESNFRIYNSTLCPDLWDEYLHLDPEVRINLLRIAYDFYEKSKLSAPIIDVYLMGSIANYNWTSDSDADIHVIIDYSKLKMPEETAFKTVKMLSTTWNLEHQITVKNHKVEINLQNVKEVKPHVTGIYSLTKDQWVRKPFYQKVQVDKVSIQTKYSGMKKYIESVMNTRSRETMKKAKDYIDAFRQYGLDTRGELSIENIVFKILRSKGLIKALKDAITATYDKEMTVTETNHLYKNSVIVGNVDNNHNVINVRSDANHISYYYKRWRYKLLTCYVFWWEDFEEEDKQSVDEYLHKHYNVSVKLKHVKFDDLKDPVQGLDVGQRMHGLRKLSSKFYKEMTVTEGNNSDTKSKYFTLKFGDPNVSKGAGVIYLGDLYFANVYRDTFFLGDKFGKWIFNRSGGALNMKHPGYDVWFDKPEDVLPMLDDWYEKNKPIDEGYGAGIPGEDRLHIKGHRWQIRSKDAPKTPKMIDKDLNELIQQLVNETIQKLSDINK